MVELEYLYLGKLAKSAEKNFGKSKMADFVNKFASRWVTLLSNLVKLFKVKLFKS